MAKSSNKSHVSAVQRLILPIIALAAIVLVSGCVNQQQVQISGDVNGILIKNVYVEPPADQLLSGETIIISADIENVGSATAHNVIVELIGASWFGGTLYNYNNVRDDYTGLPGTSLTPPDPRYNTPGQVKPIEFRLPAPMIPEGQKASYDLILRVDYQYETSAVAQVKGYSRERYNTLLQQGKLSAITTASIPTQVSKNVPVTISIDGPDKISVGPLYEEYTYRLTFNNVGSNVPITIDPYTGREKDGLILGTVWVQGPGVFFRQCLGIAPETLYSNAPNTLNQFLLSMQVQYKDKFSAWYQTTPWGDFFGGTVKIGNILLGVQSTPVTPRLQVPTYVLFPNALSWDVLGFLMDPIILRKGQTVTKSCTIGILNDPSYPNAWNDRSEDSIAINAHLQYRYFVDSPLTITVAAPIVRTPFAG